LANDLNRIKVLFFAALRDRAGTKSVEIEVPETMTVQGLKDRIAGEFPNLGPSMGSVLVSINREYAFDASVVPQNAEVAIFPPVSGG
jgi:molybdopterin converting factor subunit 1